MHRLFRNVVVLFFLSLTPSLAWADVTPLPPNPAQDIAAPGWILVPVAVLFLLGIAAVVYTLNKKRAQRDKSPNTDAQ